MCGRYGQWPQAKSSQLGEAVNPHRTERYVTDDRPRCSLAIFRVNLADQRDDDGLRSAKRCDDLRLVGPSKRQFDNRSDLGLVLWPIVPHAERIAWNSRVTEPCEPSVILQRHQ